MLGRLFSGTLWLALRAPLQVVFSLWTIPLILQAIGPRAGAYGFAWGFGFFQMLLEFGMGSALQRQVSETWTKGDHRGVDRAIACGMNFYAAMAAVQAVALLAIAYFGVPRSFSPEFVSFSRRRNHARLYCHWLLSRVPKSRTPTGTSLKRKPRKSAVKGWMPTRTESKS